MPLSPVNLCPIYRHNLNCTTQFRHFATETSLARSERAVTIILIQIVTNSRTPRAGYSNSRGL
jgi:hypothetical protein